MKNMISLLAGLKNNLDYSKHFYYTTRALYPDVEIVFTSYNSTDGTHEWLDSLQDENLIYYYSAEEKTFSDTYNKCTQLATKPYVAFTHNDVVLTPNFIENLEKNVSNNLVIYYTTIEPPIFSDDERPGKIVKDFGEDLETININALYQFALKIQEENKDVVIPEDGTTFFLCADRQVLLTMGGLDALYNPMFCEDDDLILRLRLAGLKTITALDAICYHFVSKTSRFSEEYQARTALIEENSNKNFVRKWGFSNSSPIKKKYDVGLIVENCNLSLLKNLEPWATVIYADCDAEAYIGTEQAKTKFNLRDKIKPLNSLKTNDILISFNSTGFNDKAFERFKHMTEIITRKINQPASFYSRLFNTNKLNFKTGIFRVEIRNIKSHEHELITIKP